jgi:hypothetical protein
MTDGNCPPGQLCSLAGACSPPLPVGASCEDAPTLPGACARDLACLPLSNGAGTGACAKRPGQGESCFGTTADGASEDLGCASGLTCDGPGGTCITPTYASIGERCGGDFTPYCAGSFCSNGTCVPYGTEGSPCSVHGIVPCESDLVCTAGKCARVASLTACAARDGG